MADNDDLLDYEDEEQTEHVVAETTEAPKKDVKGTYVSIHSSGFRDFLLKPEILRAIADCGFEHPSEGKCSNNLLNAFNDNLNVLERDRMIIKKSRLCVLCLFSHS